MLILPARRQPRDHARQQVRHVCAEKFAQGFLEVTGRDAAQVEHRQQRIEALRTPRPSRQDVRGESRPVCLGDVRASVPHLGTTNVDRADPGLDGPLRAVSVPYNPLAAVRKHVIGKAGNEGVRLRLQRCRQHAPRPFTGNLGQRIFDRIRMTKRDDPCIFLHGVSLLSWRFWQVQHPPRYAAFSGAITQIQA